MQFFVSNYKFINYLLLPLMTSLVSYYKVISLIFIYIESRVPNNLYYEKQDLSFIVALFIGLLL